MNRAEEVRPVDQMTEAELYDEFCYGCTDDGEWEVKDEDACLDDSFQIICPDDK